ncbi:hypothetical protein MMC30_000476 [Trapelia coarctata]|nr:hypothetical protein [Trapelia coarctata]
MPTSISPETEETEWDESRIQSSLAHLQNMHIQLRHLRETIPSLMRAVHTEHSSPEDLYTDISQAAVRAVDDIKSFTAYIEESANQEVLKNARQSREKSGEGIKSWLVTQHPNWLERTVVTGVKELKLEEEAATDAENNGDNVQEDIPAIVAKFKEQHAEIDVAMNPEGSMLTVSLPSSPRLSFDIDLQPKPTSTEMYNVSIKDSRPLYASINQAISKRPRHGGLLLLLEALPEVQQTL